MNCLKNCSLFAMRISWIRDSISQEPRYKVKLNDKILLSDSGAHYIGEDNRSGKEWVGALVEELNKFFETEDDTYHFLDHFKVNNGLPQPIFPKLLNESHERVEVMKNSEDPDQLFSLSMEGESRIRIVMQRRVEYAEIDKGQTHQCRQRKRELQH